MTLCICSNTEIVVSTHHSQYNIFAVTIVSLKSYVELSKFPVSEGSSLICGTYWLNSMKAVGDRKEIHCDKSLRKL